MHTKDKKRPVLINCFKDGQLDTDGDRQHTYSYFRDGRVTVRCEQTGTNAILNGNIRDRRDR